MTDEDRTDGKARSRWRPGCWILAMVAALPVLWWCTTGSQIPFDQEAWCAEGRLPCGERHRGTTIRHRMIKDLIDHQGVLGMTSGDLRRLLGEPDEVRSGGSLILEYWFQGPSILDDDQAPLYFFIEDGRVVGVKCYRYERGKVLEWSQIRR